MKKERMKDEMLNQDEMTEEKDKKKKLLALLLALLLFLAGGAMTYSLFGRCSLNQSNQPNKQVDKNINIGDIVGMTQEEMQEAMNARVKYNMVNINMNTSITISGKTIANLDLNNNSNKYDGYKYSADGQKDNLAVSCTDGEEKTCIKYDGTVVKVNDFEEFALTKSLAVTLTVEGAEEPLFESGLVPYGSYLKIGTCNYQLPKGEHKANAVISSYDENGNYLGQSIVKVTLYQVD